MDVKELREHMRATKRLGEKFDSKKFELLAAVQDSFPCARCGQCCREQMLGMRGPEIAAAARALGIKGSEFKARYIEAEIEHWFIVKKIDGNCPFLVNDDVLTTACLIYQARPETCRRFPWLTPEIYEKSTLTTLACNEAICPHMTAHAEKLVKEANR